MVKKKHVNKVLIFGLVISGGLLILLAIFQKVIFKLSIDPQSPDILAIYYHKQNKDMSVDCKNLSTQLITINKEDKTIEKTIAQIITGPDQTAQKLGYVSFFSNQTQHIIKNNRVEDKTMYINFYDFREFAQNNDSPLKNCSKEDYFAPLTKTLEQNFGMTQVVYAIEDNPETFTAWTGTGCGILSANCPKNKFQFPQSPIETIKTKTLTNKVTIKYPKKWYLQKDVITQTPFDDENLLTKTLIASEPIMSADFTRIGVTRVLIIEKKQSPDNTICNSDKEECVTTEINNQEAKVKIMNDGKKIRMHYLINKNKTDYIILVDNAFNNTANNDYELTENILQSITIE